jgi:hypothetical protein
MLSRVKIFYFLPGEPPTTHGYPRIYGGADPSSSEASFEAQISHFSYTDLVRKLEDLMPLGRLKDVWQVAHGASVYFDESNYHGVRRDAPLTALFVV